jgi:ABC-type polysaccharide/polyol phosphate transport system ATPase subunit
MATVTVTDVHKHFRIPSVRRHTVREHLFGAFERRSWEQLRVLDGVSFEVKPGETFGIMGRNGCGKSTLLKIIAGIYQPDGGSVHVSGPLTPVLELGVGMNGELTAEDNALLNGTAMGLTAAEIRRDLQTILAFAELERFANLELKHFSSGMAARLSYSIAFHAVRDVLLIDEVLAVGDAAFNAKCKARFVELKRSGRTTVLVGHNTSTIEEHCDRAILIDNGKITVEGEPKRITEAYNKMLGAT